MAETLPTEFERTDIGEIQIAPEVIEVIAGLATVEVRGVAGMSGGFAGGIAELLGRKNLSKGVKVEVGQREAAVDVSVIVATICSVLLLGLTTIIIKFQPAPDLTEFIWISNPMCLLSGEPRRIRLSRPGNKT
ncbi:Asp23/Gls24 family envelope stress response protein [Paenibacillus glucanolyticus]|uniref:Asp23/Gls24 family envelope stress response protein n=1 Tax=Paenibacillus glucanolyticus TaxID=59843 RepID=UPI003D08AB53